MARYLSPNCFWWQDQRPLGTSLGCVETPQSGSPHLTRQPWKEVEKINWKKSKYALVLVKNCWMKKVKWKTRSNEHINFTIKIYTVQKLHAVKFWTKLSELQETVGSKIKVLKRSLKNERLHFTNSTRVWTVLFPSLLWSDTVLKQVMFLMASMSQTRESASNWLMVTCEKLSYTHTSVERKQPPPYMLSVRM